MFKGALGCIEGIPGHYGMFGVFQGCSRVLRDVPGVFRGCSGLFRGCSESVPGPGVPQVFRVLQIPHIFGDFRLKTMFKNSF